MSSRSFTQALSAEEHATRLLTEMTVEEKVAQLWGVWLTNLINTERQFAPDKARPFLQHGIGQISRIGASSLLPPQQSAELANQIQHFLVEETRLGIPAMVHEESCAGYLARGATTFPQAIGLAATWQPELLEKMTEVIRQQMRAVGAHHSLAPVLDVARDPRWGRMEETFGEDPFLISALGVAYIKGLQGADLTQGIIATAKHFLGYGWSEGGMNWAPAHIPERELREIFLTPFVAAIREANIRSFMNAYHELDGVPCGSSYELLVQLLRDELGFDGILASDYFTINMLVEYHHVAANKTEAARLALQAGMDLELPTADCYGEPLLQALRDGTIDIDLVNVCVQRILKLKHELGLFENPYIDTGRVPEFYDQPEQIDLSRELAQKSLVLLKNNTSLLPLPKTLGSIAVIGPSADSGRLLQGDYHYPSHMEGIFNPDVSLDSPNPVQPVRALDWTEHFPPSVTVLQGIQAKVSADTQIRYAKGCDILSEDTSGFAEAVEIARQSEVAIIVVGDKSGLSRGATTGESIDRVSLTLPGVQQALIEAIHATGTPTIVVLTIGRALALPWIAENIPSVLVAWLPAQQGGAAIADALFGDVNPAGRLPVSFPRDVGQLPVYYNHKPSGGRTHWQGEYVEMSAKPLFPFGHGLSYSTFDYSDLHVTPQQIEPGGVVEIQVTICNSGQYAGDEVVQLYVHDPVASVTRPVKALKGFQRLTLQPSEAKTLTFTLDTRHLAFYDRLMNYVIEPGKIEVLIGGSSEDIRLSGSFEILGQTTPVEAVFSTPVKIS